MRGEVHGMHADVVHAGYAGAHDQAATRHLKYRQLTSTDSKERDCGREKGEQQGNGDPGKAVGDHGGQTIGQHADVMHGPNAQAH